MAKSQLKLTAPALASELRTKRQRMAGMVRQALLDADRQRVGVGRTTLETQANLELRHEVELFQQVLALLTQRGMEPRWLREDNKRIDAVQRDLELFGADE